MKGGQTVGTVHHKCEVSCVLADMDILCRQPERLLIAGVYDAMAKLPELRHRLYGKDEADIDVGLLASAHMSEFILNKLAALLPAAVADLRAGECTKAIYDTVYISIALTGAVSGMARGSNQCAIAHKVYEVTRTLFPDLVRERLHGELVAMGLIVQLDYNGDKTGAENLAHELRGYGMPTRLSELGIVPTDEVVRDYTGAIENSSALAGASFAELIRFRDAFSVLLG